MKRGLVSAAALPVALMVVAVPASADTGELVGDVVAAATGQPIAGACVTVFDPELNQVAQGCVDDAGHFDVPDLPIATYRVRATADGYADLWAYDKGSALAADTVYLPGNLRFELRQGSGSVHGTVTDVEQPAPGALVSITDQNQQWVSTVETGADGTYEFTGLTPDDYKLQVTFGDRSQWVHQKLDMSAADPITVADGATVTLDEQLLPYAVVKVHVIDAVTNKPVPHACAYLNGLADATACAGNDGVVTYPAVPGSGTYQTSAYDPAGMHWPSDDQDVTVTAGQTTDVTVPLTQAAAIHTTIRDATTKAPVADVCVEEHAVPVRGVEDRDYLDHCSDASGAVVIGPITPGAYQLLVKPYRGNYGVQWVGGDGRGTGDLRTARTVAVSLGAAVTISAITMDPPGSVTGKVTDKATGAGLNLVCAYPYAVDPAGGLGFGVNCTRNGGTFTISGLGPYQWPIEYFDSTGAHATTWSGAAANRYAATPVKVIAGKTVTANAATLPAGRVSGQVVDRQGNPAFAYITTFNARTGDIVDSTTTVNDGPYTVDGLASQDVKIEFYVDTDCWHRNARDFAHATPVRVTAGATTALNLGPCTLPSTGKAPRPDRVRAHGG